MASQNSFDVTTGVDLQEVDNAVNQALKEIRQRFDFKGSKCVIEFDRARALIALAADDAFRMKALLEVLRTKLAGRHVPERNLNIGDDQSAGGDRVKKEITLTQGIPGETARRIVKAFKAEKFKKVQIAIQGDQLRVSSNSKDALQSVQAFLKGQDFGIELRFENYR